MLYTNQDRKIRWRTQYHIGTMNATREFTSAKGIQLPGWDSEIRRYTTMNIVEYYHLHQHAMRLRHWNKYEDLIQIYKNTGNGNYFCHNEKMADFGKLVADIDIEEPALTEYLNQFPMDNGLPMKFVDEIRELCYRTMIDIGFSKQAEYLLQDRIQWFSEAPEDGNPYPFGIYGDSICVSNSSHDKKVSIHFTLPFVPGRRIKGASIYEDNFHTDGEPRVVFMRKFYESFNNLARQKYKFVRLMKGQNLLDIAMLGKNHEHRLPGFTKAKYIGDEKREFKIISKNNIIHCLSAIRHYMVPENLHLEIPDHWFEQSEDMMYGEHNIGDVHLDNSEQLWDLICSMVPGLDNDFSGLKSAKDGDRQILQLIPIGRINCPVCKCEHQNVVPNIYKSNDKYILGCRQWHRVHKHESNNIGRGPIILNLISDSSNEEINLDSWQAKLLEQSKQKYTPIYNNRRGMDCRCLQQVNTKDLEFIPEVGDVYICSTMGTSKTKGVFAQLDDTDQSYIIISNRVIQAKKFGHRLPDAVVYGQWSNWQKEQKLIVQMESLHRCTRHNYNIVVLDEIETLLRLLNGSTMADKELHTIHKLIQYIQRADRVIVLDAFLKKETIEFIQQLRNGKCYSIIVNMFRQVDGRQNISTPKQALIYRNKDQWNAKLLDDKRRKVITCMSKKVANQIASSLRESGETVLLITADTPEHVKSLDPHDKDLGWDKYHNIVYTPALANSISFEKEWFDVQYVYACRGSAGPEDLIQMMGRVRNITDSNIHMYIDNRFMRQTTKQGDAEDNIKCQKFMPLNVKGVYKSMQESSQIFEEMISKPLLARIWETMNDNIKSLFARLMVDESLGQRFFKEILIHILEEVMGWQIIKDTTYERKQSLKKDNIFDENDMAVFHRYIDEGWKGDPQKGISHCGSDYAYKSIWCKHKKNIITNVACMVRGGENNVDEHYDVSKGMEMMDDLREIFRIGGQDLEDCISKKEKVILKLEQSDRLDILLKRMAVRYGLTINMGRKWEWLRSFLTDYLLLETQKESLPNKGQRKYTYIIDMTDWIGYHVIMREFDTNYVT